MLITINKTRQKFLNNHKNKIYIKKIFKTKILNKTNNTTCILTIIKFIKMMMFLEALLDRKTHQE